MKKVFKVFKFGGAFFDPKIIRDFKFFQNQDDDNRLYVVSAVKGVTRLLKNIFDILIQKDLDKKFKTKIIDEFLDEFVRIHKELIFGLFDNPDEVLNDFELLFTDLEKTILDRPVNNDQYYSSILKYGELASSRIFNYYLSSIGVENIWFDARDYVLTNADYCEAKIISVKSNLKELLKKKVLVTQGFIGRSITGKDTVIGFDGSDESAARFALFLSDDYQVEITFFKDVLGVYNGDPKKNEKVELFLSITTEEYLLLVEEVGSYVVRPDSISHLVKKSIPIRIRSYLDLNNLGTLVKD